MAHPKKRTAAELGISAEVAWYLSSRGIPLPQCPPKVITPSPGLVRGAQFSPERVDRLLAAFRLLRHTQGKWAGTPLVPDPWQIAYILAPTFGWIRWDKEAGGYVRIVRKLYVDVPRRNGKTTLAGGIAVYMTAADGEPGAQVYALATNERQARFTFDPIRKIAEQAPALKGHVKAYTNKIVHPASGSYFTVVSSVAEAMHGASVQAAIIDELHVHKTADLVETVETGTGSRRQPLVVTITTADDGRPNTIYARKRHYIEQLAKRAIRDPQTYGVVWGAEESDDPFSPTTWRKANPGYGVSPSVAYLTGAAAEAKQDPAAFATFLRLHLGIRTKQQTRYITLADWDGAAAIVDEAALEGRACHGGLDLSNVEDITALCWLFPDRETGVIEAIWRFWLPADRLRDLSKRTAGAADVWVREGWLTLTPGNVIDLDAILAQIDRDAQRYSVQTVGYDRWGATDVVRRLGDKGMTCVPISQGTASLNDPLKNLLRTLKGGLFRQNGHPIMRWMVDNLATLATVDGLVKPDKKNSGDKIDGVSATVNAMKECMDAVAAEEPAPPASADTAAPWDDRDLWRPTGRLNI